MASTSTSSYTVTYTMKPFLSTTNEPHRAQPLSYTIASASHRAQTTHIGVNRQMPRWDFFMFFSIQLIDVPFFLYRF
jgi:hypothetical protein